MRLTAQKLLLQAKHKWFDHISSMDEIERLRVQAEASDIDQNGR